MGRAGVALWWWWWGSGVSAPSSCLELSDPLLSLFVSIACGYAGQVTLDLALARNRSAWRAICLIAWASFSFFGGKIQRGAFESSTSMVVKRGVRLMPLWTSARQAPPISLSLPQARVCSSGISRKCLSIDLVRCFAAGRGGGIRAQALACVCEGGAMAGSLQRVRGGGNRGAD